MTNQIKEDQLFNSPLETGIRSVCILSVDESMKFDLQQLLALDYLVVHTGDIKGAPPSLHPNVRQRSGELLVRRKIVEQGLILMESKNLVLKEFTSKGLYYSASDFASIFIESLTNDYIKLLCERSKWAVNEYKSLGDKIFETTIKNSFDKWTKEFQIAELPLGRYND